MEEIMSGMSFVGSKLYSANKLALNTCFCEHVMLNYYVSYQILRLGGLTPYSMDPHGFLTTQME